MKSPIGREERQPYIQPLQEQEGDNALRGLGRVAWLVASIAALTLVLAAILAGLVCSYGW